jgi:hypothetical protein
LRTHQDILCDPSRILQRSVHTEVRERKCDIRWATSQYQGTRVKGEKWHPVKCDMVAKQAILHRSVADDKTLSQTVCQNFSKDNQAEGIDFTATKAHWLSREDYKKKVGSLVIWLKTKFAADYLLKSGTASFGATGAYCSKRDLREKELPCFNCQSQSRAITGLTRSTPLALLQGQACLPCAREFLGHRQTRYAMRALSADCDHPIHQLLPVNF